MTLGINPNLTVFQTRKNAAAWIYPLFRGDHRAQADARYAWYYRHHDLFQESLALDDLGRFLVEGSEVRADAPGKLESADRDGVNPRITLKLRLAHEETNKILTLTWNAGEPGYSVLLELGASFEAGHLLAAKIRLPEGTALDFLRQSVGYNECFAKVFGAFARRLDRGGLGPLAFSMAEDLCQADMVACASPHWKSDYLGGQSEVDRIVHACTQHHDWALKQLVQTRPAVLVLVGEGAWGMFMASVGHRIDPPFPVEGTDGSFARLLQSIETPRFLRIPKAPGDPSTTTATRVLVAPHFSYGDLFEPQSRFSPDEWNDFSGQFQQLVSFLRTLECVKAPKPDDTHNQGGFWAVRYHNGADAILTIVRDIEPDAFDALASSMRDPVTLLAAALEEEVRAGHLPLAEHHGHASPGLARASGGCRFCVGRGGWPLPTGCPYDKQDQPSATIAEVNEIVTWMLNAAMAPGAGHGQ